MIVKTTVLSTNSQPAEPEMVLEPLLVGLLNWPRT
jgi:hypothetical protein